jgi:hypothetical protein
MAIWNICISAIRYILWRFGNLVAIWYIFHCFGILNKENSGNPAPEAQVMKPVFLFLRSSPEQGCQLVCFQTKNPNFGGSCNGKSWYIL